MFTKVNSAVKFMVSATSTVAHALLYSLYGLLIGGEQSAG